MKTKCEKKIRHKEIKETEMGKIREEWEIVKLGEVCEFKRGFSYRSNQITKDFTKVRFITINNIEKEGGIKRDSEKIFIKESVNIDPELFLNKGDILIANTDMSKGFIIGAPILIENINGKLIYSMDLTKLIFNKSKINSKFLFYYLKHNIIRQKMKSFAQGTNVLHLNHDLAKLLKLPLPPLPEQQKIAEILSTVDSAIEKVNQAIEKTQRLKKGLMQELLTKGIGHNEFKDTEIGRIPKEWEVVKLEEIFDIQVGGDIYKLNFSKQKNERYKFPIYSNSLENNGLYGYADTYQYPENCITVTGRGTLGRATPRFEKFNAIIRLLVLIPKANISIMFVSEYINARIGFRVEKTSIPQLTAPKLAKYKLPLPPLPEQQKIAEILSTVDKRLELLKKKKEKLERIKKGLMNDLLTGKRIIRIC